MAQRRTWASYVIWGSIAVCAVFAAAFTIALVVGSHRGIQFAGAPKRTAPLPSEQPLAKAPAPTVTSHELARVNDALRDLAAERDRLAARLEQVERTVGDITASIKERATPVTTAATPSSPASAPPRETAATPVEPEPQQIVPPRATPKATAPAVGSAQSAGTGEPIDIFRPYAAAQPLVGQPAPAQAPMQIHAAPRTTESTAAREPARDSTATRTEFAIDLGAEPTMDGLRALWASLRGNHGTTLNGLRPLVSIREGAKPGSMELRLIAGPLANAGAAARTCATLQTKGVTCQTTVFDGQRLALR